MLSFFMTKFEARMNILFITKVEILFPINISKMKRSHRSPFNYANY